jgi:CRP/FNR family cyclic AMP-dependent transcriptional regulator
VRMPLVSGSSKRIARAMERVVELADGDVVVEEGEPGHELFVIRSGAIEIYRSRPDGEQVLGRLERGDVFGEMSVLESLPRDASARAVGATTLLAMGRGALLLRLRQDPSFALELLHLLSGRIRALNERLDRR